MKKVTKNPKISESEGGGDFFERAKSSSDYEKKISKNFGELKKFN